MTDNWFRMLMMRGYRREATELLNLKKRMNQTDFGYLVGLKQGQVSRYERGFTPVTDEILEKVQKTMEVLRDGKT